MSKKLFGLELKVLGVLLLLVVVASTTLGYFVVALVQAKTNQSLLADVTQLETQSSSLFRRSDNYLDSAPRSFEHYNRDLVIFYPNFKADLASLGETINHLGDTYSEVTLAGAGHWMGTGIATPELDAAMLAMLAQWQGFDQGLKAKLGDDLTEPRLEWGVEFIRENQQALRSSIDALTVGLHAAVDLQSDTMLQTSRWGIWALAASALLGMLWFYFGVVRRIKRAAAGCVRVSTGDFGYQIPVDSRDEIGALSLAINNLSKRARLVLSVSEKVRSAPDAKQAITAFWDEAEPLLELQWAGVFEINLSPENSTKTDTTLDLCTYMPAHSAIARNYPLSKQRYLEPLLRKRSPVLIDSLSEFVSKQPMARLIREVYVKNSQSQSLLMLPLGHGSVTGVLVLSSSSADVFSQEHISLLENLLPQLSDSLLPEYVAQEEAA